MQSSVNYDVTLDSKEMNFLEVGKRGLAFV